MEAALRTGRIAELWLDANRHDARLSELAAAAAERGVAMHRTPRQQLDQLLPALRHQGAVARCHGAPRWSEADLEVLLIGLPHPPLVLVLDGIQDPHNLGACLRSADAAGVHAIVAPRDRAVGITPAVRKVASGAAETVPFVQVTNLARTLRHLQELGLWRVGAAGEAPVTLYEVDLRGPLALLLGAEGKGLRRLTREHCDTLVRIPMLGAVASLNVAVATGICLFEAQRQRTVGAAHAATAASDPTPTGR